MPGFLGGGGSSSSGTGGEIRFPKEFVDPVTKLRVSNPQNLIDTDFEYGLQPTKWETVEVINNTPSFFSKSGDTTIPGIQSITTNAGTREITVTTALDHGLAAGIPIRVEGTKSLTADGSYIINSIPNTKTFTYLCRDDQPTTASIEDLYSVIITGEFFQGSQLRIADSEGVVTDGEGISTLTVKTESAHGFGVNTPFYFLNLNSTISQEFQASNTAAKSFDASNSATAQTFDGSNTLSSIPVDWSNSATVGGNPSTITGASTTENTITVSHEGADNFLGLPVGTPLYYKISTGVGYFNQNPYGVVFLKTVDNLGEGVSTFQVSDIPDGDRILIQASLSGTIVVANQARTFAGNNIDPETQQTFPVIKEDPIEFEAANDGGPVTEDIFENGNPLCTVSNYSGSLVNVTVGENLGLGYYRGAMVLYETDGGAASGLTDNTTYFIDSFFPTGQDTFAFTIKSLPTDESPISISGGTGVQTFRRIGVSLDKDLWHIKDSQYIEGDMLKYDYPTDGEVTTDTTKRYFFVKTAYDSHNYELSDTFFNPTIASGGTLTTTQYDGSTWNVHRFTSVGTSSFTVSEVGTDNDLEYLVVGGGGGGGSDMGGGGGAGGYQAGVIQMSGPGTYTVTVGGGGNGAPAGVGQRRGFEGGSSSFVGNGTNILSYGGGGGASNHDRSNNPAGGVNRGINVGSGGGASGGGTLPNGGTGGGGYGGGIRGTGTPGQGNDGGTGVYAWFPGAGGGAGAVGTSGVNNRMGNHGGEGIKNDILGIPYYWAGGGGASGYSGSGGNGGLGGGGGGAVFLTSGGAGLNNGSAGGGGSINSQTQRPGGAGGANTGGGGGGGSHYSSNNRGGNGGSGIVVVRYRATPKSNIVPSASGGQESTVIVGNTTYRVHQFLSSGSDTFTVSEVGNIGAWEYLIVAGGGGGGMDMGGGGGAGGVLMGGFVPTAGSYPIVVGGGGAGAPTAGTGANTQGRTSHQYGISAQRGGNSSAFGLTAQGGGLGGSSYFRYSPNSGFGGGGGSGGGASAYSDGSQNRQGGGTVNQGQNGGWSFGQYYGGGGGGANGNGGFGTSAGDPIGGRGRVSDILGTPYYFGGGGGGAGHSTTGGRGGQGGGGGGGYGNNPGDTNGLNPGGNGVGPQNNNNPGGDGGANTGGGGGGGGHYSSNNRGGNGGSGIVVIRYPIEIN